MALMQDAGGGVGGPGLADLLMQYMDRAAIPVRAPQYPGGMPPMIQPDQMRMLWDLYHRADQANPAAGQRLYRPITQLTGDF